MPTLTQYRQSIDQLDQQILTLLNQRAEVVCQIGHFKKEHHLPVYQPSRESQILENLTAKNEGPLKNEHIFQIFNAIIAACRSLE